MVAGGEEREHVQRHLCTWLRSLSVAGILVFLALQVQKKLGAPITLDVVGQGVLEFRDQVLATRFRDRAKDASVERHGLQFGLHFPTCVGQNKLGAGTWGRTSEYALPLFQRMLSMGQRAALVLLVSLSRSGQSLSSQLQNILGEGSLAVSKRGCCNEPEARPCCRRSAPWACEATFWRPHPRPHCEATFWRRWRPHGSEADSLSRSM